MAWMAKIPAAASASQSEMVSFFMVILLGFSGSAPRNKALKSVNCDEFAINDIRPVLQGVIELKSGYFPLVTVRLYVKQIMSLYSTVLY